MTSRLLISLVLALAAVTAWANPSISGPSPAAKELYIIEFNHVGAMHYQGGVPGLESTSGMLRSRVPNAGATPRMQAYLSHVESQQISKEAEIASAIGRTLQVKHRYRVTHSGIAAELSSTEVDAIRRMPGVVRVYLNEFHELVTDSGPQWIGAESIWDGTATGGLPGSKGEGVIVGVLDTGINIDHPSFSDTPEDGYTFINPFGDGVFIGECDGTFVCNNKLIGVWDFAGDGPEDTNGHGSHTASTAAGNEMAGPFIETGSGGAFPAASMSGVAPHANIISYDVCISSCSSAAILGAIDQAILDGVDVINFSISGGLSPWVDNDRRFLDATAAGITVVAAAGNTSAGVPNPVGQVNHRAPWVLSVANQTHDRAVLNEIIGMASTGVAPPADITGASFTLGYGPAPIVYAGDFPNANDPGNDPAQCLEGYPAGTWTGGEIVMCDRGAIARVQKCANVQAGGAAGCILADVAGSPGRVADPHVIPATHINEPEGDIMRGWLSIGSDHSGEITDSVLVNDPALGSFLSGSSLRGPNASFDVTKPDIGAPGSNIFAAYADSLGAPPQLTFLSGTSMASPHTAGAAALLKSLHPNWSPSEIQSALMMSARQGFNEVGDPANPDLEGSGTVDLTKAAETGLLMDETFARYLAANPATGGDPSTLNIPSMRSNDCDGNCTWQRVVCAALDTNTDWTVAVDAPAGTMISVTPPSFSLLGGDTLFVDGLEGNGMLNSSCQTLDIEMTITDNQLVIDGNVVFGSFTMSEDSAQAPDAAMTVSVVPTGTD